jgi:hypothetical protein
MTEKTFDEINEIFTNMSEEDYELTRQAANDYYQYGNTALLEIAEKRTGLSGDIILNWW